MFFDRLETIGYLFWPLAIAGIGISFGVKLVVNNVKIN
jgi:hypothetical protein